MTYQYYSLNYDKLTKIEKHSNTEFQKRFLKEAEQESKQRLKESIDERLKKFMESK